MKWSIFSFRWFFAIIPHKCCRCDDYFWLENGVKHKIWSGKTKIYCKECAPYVWYGAKVKGKDDES